MQISSIAQLNLNNNFLQINFKGKKPASQKNENPSSQAPIGVDSYGRAQVQQRCNIKNEKGETRFWTIKSKDGFSLFYNNGNMIYEKRKTPQNSTIDTYQTLEGIKTYSVEHLPGGVVIRKNYDKNGNLQRIIKYNLLQDVESNENFQIATVSEETRQGLPQYLYHITSLENLEEIQKEGLKAATEMDLHLNGDNAVFLISEHDLLNTWCNLTCDSAAKRNDSLLARLLKYCDKAECNDLVIIKVATSKLDINSLRLRNEIDVMCSNPIQTFMDEKYLDDFYLLCEELPKASGRECNSFTSEIVAENIFLEERNRRLREGLSLDNYAQFTKTPFEFFYTKDINPQAIEAVCKLDTREIKDLEASQKSCEIISKKLVQNCIDSMN